MERAAIVGPKLLTVVVWQFVKFVVTFLNKAQIVNVFFVNFNPFSVIFFVFFQIFKRTQYNNIFVNIKILYHI